MLRSVVVGFVVLGSMPAFHVGLGAPETSISTRSGWRQMDAAETDLYRLDAATAAIKTLTAKQICEALRHDDEGALLRATSRRAEIQGFAPGRRQLLQTGPAGEAYRIVPARPLDYGEPQEFARALQSMTRDWVAVERCFFKPFRLNVSTTSPRWASASFHLWLAGLESSGERTTERGDIQAELEEQSDGSWTFRRVAFGPRMRFRAPVAAFADWTTRSDLPTTWVDEGYDVHDLAFGQLLYGGVSTGDYDGDGDNDIYVSRAGQNLLLRNDGDGAFDDVTAEAGVGDDGNGQSAVWADFDNDGDQDLFVVNAAYTLITTSGHDNTHVLYRNDGDGAFSRMSTRFEPVGPASGATVADFDADGLLDIYVTYYQDKEVVPYHDFVDTHTGFGNRLFRNLGELNFVDATVRARVSGDGWSYASAWADYDGDGDQDLFVANDFSDDCLYRNRGDGTFEEVAGRLGVADPGNGMSADWGDYDNDGYLDLYVANMYSKTGNQLLPHAKQVDPGALRKLQWGALGNTLYRNQRGERFQETGRDLGVNVAGWAWSSNFLDIDNDGWLDLHVANGFWAGDFEDDA